MATMQNKVILEQVKEALNIKKATAFNIFEDNNWKITLQISGAGNITFWVSYENKTGWYNSSPCLVYHGEDGQVVTSISFQIKEAVKNKVISIYKVLYSEGLMNY